MDEQKIDYDVLKKIENLDKNSDIYKILSIVSNILDSISNGSQIDPVYLQNVKNNIENHFNEASNGKRKIIKKKKVNRNEASE